MNKYIFPLLITVVATGLTQQAVAQNEIDALKFAQTSPAATGKSIGLAGANGAVGGDLSAVSTNPAALGIYRSSELTFTPNIRLNNTKANYLGTPTSEGAGKLTMSNFGMVFNNAARGSEYSAKAWKSSSFAVNYNRIADFNNVGYYNGINNQSSIVDVLARDAREYGTSYDMAPPLGALAWDTYLLDNSYNSIPGSIINSGGSLYQEKYWKTKGGINEWNFAYAGNYQEKLFIGASANILSYKYNKQSNFYEEDNTGNNNNDFANLTYKDLLDVNGVGFNLKFGMLYNVNDKGKIGFNVHTPTWTSMQEISDYSLESNTENYKYNNGGTSTDPYSFAQPEQTYTYEYNLKTPYKLGLNGMVFLGKFGFISADYEYVAYQSMKYGFDSNSQNWERTVNQNIKDTYQGGHNIRVGIEGRYDIFTGRLGTAYYSSPFQNSSLYGGDRFNVSAGLGIKLGKVFFDLAYMYTLHKQNEYAYPITYSGIPVGISNINYNNSQVALTVGFKM